MVGRAAVWSTMLAAVAIALAAGSGAATTTTTDNDDDTARQRGAIRFRARRPTPGSCAPGGAGRRRMLRGQRRRWGQPGRLRPTARRRRRRAVPVLCGRCAGEVVVARATVNDYGTPSSQRSTAAPCPPPRSPRPTTRRPRRIREPATRRSPIDPVVGISSWRSPPLARDRSPCNPSKRAHPWGHRCSTRPHRSPAATSSGTAGPFSSFAVTADGDWTIRMQRLSSALELTATTPVTRRPTRRRVLRRGTTALALTLEADGAGPLTVIAVTAAGPVTLLEPAGPVQRNARRRRRDRGSSVSNASVRGR